MILDREHFKIVDIYIKKKSFIFTFQTSPNIVKCSYTQNKLEFKLYYELFSMLGFRYTFSC